MFRGVELVADADSDRIFLMFPEFCGNENYEFPLLCWEGARVAAFNLEVNNRLDDGSVIYTVTPDSDLLLEPFRPVSVTEAVEGAGCVWSADVRFRAGPDEPFWMAKGKLVHSLFEQLLCNPSTSARQFQEVFKRSLPTIKRILPGSSVWVTEKELKAEAGTHFNNLKSWLKDNGKGLSAVEVEVDRVSARWGLKGRADAIFHNGERGTIVELKSGRFAADDHLLQLFAYLLLFFDEGKKAELDGCVLYSAIGRLEKLQRPQNHWKRTILLGRNRIISLKHSYTLNGLGSSDDQTCGRTGKCFARPSCQKIFGNSGSTESLLTGKDREYYERWFRLLSIESWAQEGNFSRILDSGTLNERLEEEVTLQVERLEILNNGEAGAKAAGEVDDSAILADSLSPDWETENPLVGGSVEVLLFVDRAQVDIGPGEEIILHRGDPGSRQAVRGRVTGCDSGRVTVNLKFPYQCAPNDGSQLAELMRENQSWLLDRIPFSRGPEISRHALFNFFSRGDSRIVNLVVHGEAEQLAESPGQEGREAGHVPRISSIQGQSEDSRDDLCFSEGLDCELNEDQEAAINAALETDTYHLVHGPPGTGKTRVLARLIRICLDRGERLLVACPTNVALDRLLIGLMDLGVKDFLRIGGRTSVSREFLDRLERLGNPPILLEDLTGLDCGFKEFRKRVSDIKLIGATAYQCTAHPIFLRKRFDRVIVDEAGQLDEPSTLGPLSLALKVVLGGDHLQLPPIVQTRPENSAFPGDVGLEQSLFERLYNSSRPKRISSLRMQYRMNREIQDVPSRLFYEGRLLPAPEAACRRLSTKPGVSDDDRINRIIDPDIPVVFVDVEGADSGKARPEEAAVACNILESLVESGVPASEIGVITPYRAQQALIRRHISNSRCRNSFFSVDTVDRFQGGEREVIILSLARSDEVTSFLADRKRLNVSLSRARSKLILLGHGPILMDHPLFVSLLDGLERVTVKSG
ncbi:MAG: AAA family ATPase [Desulfomonile tiedjei]|nr:AAA family ATPase [Desulfomonile tiedjei]